MNYGNKTPILLVLAVIILFGAGLAYGYYYSQNRLVNTEITETDKELETVQAEILLARQKQVVSAEKGITALKLIEDNEVLWSKVISTLDKIVPVDVDQKKPIVEFTSFSGSRDGGLNFNSHTNPSSDVQKQLNAVASLIKTFNDSPVFINSFVPSIGKSITQDEEPILSFNFNTNYIPLFSSDEEEQVKEDSVPRR